MIRHFEFEDEIHQSLGCVPMAVRRKLDRVGMKIGFVQWKALTAVNASHLPSPGRFLRRVATRLGCSSAKR